MSSYRQRLYESYVTTQLRTDSDAVRTMLRSRAPYMKALIHDHFPDDRNAAVLDLGCGHGALLYFAQRAGYVNATGVDVSKEQVELARQIGVEGVSEGGIFEAISRQDEASLDVVVAFDVLEHLSKDEVLSLVQAVLRTLRPSGSFIIHVPNAASPFFGATRYGDLTHELAFTANSLQQCLLACGFESVDAYEDVPVVHGFKSVLRLLSWKLIRSLLAFYVAAETGSHRGWIFSQNLLAVGTKSKSCRLVG